MKQPPPPTGWFVVPSPGLLAIVLTIGMSLWCYLWGPSLWMILLTVFIFAMSGEALFGPRRPTSKVLIALVGIIIGITIAVGVVYFIKSL